MRFKITELQFSKFKNILEGFSSLGTPDMKYYAFDWDDNIMRMPTEIIVQDENGNEVGMSTEDFAEYRVKIGNEPFNFKGKKIVSLANDAFRNFTTKGDSKFIPDAMNAEFGPAWDDFVEAINGGSIFSIITARGHTPNILKGAVKNLIMANIGGITKKKLIQNLKRYRDLTGETISSDDEMIDEYLDLCRFYPVTYGASKVGAINPEEGKITAMKEFISYIKQMAKHLHKNAYLKNKISNNFLPTLGFSDDDVRNVEKMKSHFDKEKEKILRTYLTAGGKKRLY
jgi:hypothetical protein